MNFSEIKNLIELFESGSIRELDLEQDGIKLYLNKNETSRQTVRSEVPSIPVENHLKSVVETGELKEEAKLSVEKADVAAEGNTVKSPIVGIVYTASDPDSPIFVNVGDKVAVGDTLCIIEAMKIMNEVKSDVAGTITEVLIKNEDVVDYGQDLFRIV